MTSLHPATALVRNGTVAGDPFGATSPPLYQTSTFTQDRCDAFGEFDYTRTDNPTRRAVESLLAGLEGASGALCYTSGMAAIAGVLRLAASGERVLCGRDLYGGTQRFLHGHLDGVAVEHVDLGTDESGRCPDLERALGAAPVKLVFVETPSNPRLVVSDLRAISRAAHAHGALVVVDATAMTPWLMRPLDLGADIVLHSATKGLSGHGDVTAGVVLTRDTATLATLGRNRNAEGTALAPFESWLLARGLRTLGVRLDAAQRGALRIARALEVEGLAERVLYPGLESHPQWQLHARQSTGPGVLISLELPTPGAAAQLVERTRLFSTAVSFGGVSSSISVPHFMSHASVPHGAAPRPSDRLVRLSIGLEDPADLLDDLEQAAAGPPDLEATRPSDGWSILSAKKPFPLRLT